MSNRIWELGVAVSVGSNLEGKDIVAQQLLEVHPGLACKESS